MNRGRLCANLSGEGYVANISLSPALLSPLVFPICSLPGPGVRWTGLVRASIISCELAPTCDGSLILRVTDLTRCVNMHADPRVASTILGTSAAVTTALPSTERDATLAAVLGTELLMLITTVSIMGQELKRVHGIGTVIIERGPLCSSCPRPCRSSYLTLTGTRSCSTMRRSGGGARGCPLFRPPCPT